MKRWKYYQGLSTHCRDEGSSDCSTNRRKGGQRPTTPWRKSSLRLSRHLRLEREKPLNRNIHEGNRYSVWITTFPHSKHKTKFWEVKELNTEDKNFKLLGIKTEEFFMNTGSKHFFPKSPTSDRKKDLVELSTVKEWDKSSYDSRFFIKWSAKIARTRIQKVLVSFLRKHNLNVN